MTLFKEDTQLVKANIPWGPLQHNFTIFTIAVTCKTNKKYTTEFEFRILNHVYY